MLLIHQSGSVKIGEVIRYTITYAPLQDCVAPLPSVLYLKIRNNCPAPLRAAFMRGPYNLSVAAYPATFSPNEDFRDKDSLGVPCFEPNLRASGSWDCVLKVPENIRTLAERRKSGSLDSKHEEGKTDEVSWIVEVASQVVFSASAAVHFEVLLGRYEKLLNQESFHSFRSSTPPHSSHGHNFHNVSESNGHNLDSRCMGSFSKAIKLKVEDTAMLWNKPSLPESEGSKHGSLKDRSKSITKLSGCTISEEPVKVSPKQRIRKFHLVILTHGLHSNLGADMLYLKESIDASARQARIDARKLRRKHWVKSFNEEKSGSLQSQNSPCHRENVNSPRYQLHEDKEYDSEEDYEEEEVIVRGFSGNATRTEKGIKYLGKRLARYVMSTIYPDCPFPSNRKRDVTHSLSHAIKTDSYQSHGNKTNLDQQEKKRMYKFTSISFIGHSLGGLVQTYTIAYIQKHWPDFFEKIRPINFIALATPFLGLSNENPLYVKFALDFGLVGRTGQDLGLTWLAPTIAKRSWGAFIGGISDNSSKTKDHNEQCRPESKPLLQILPIGPAHVALGKFKKRTIYSNVVNDGIVPLRTSCLLFVDWQALGRVEKARRDSSLMEKVAEWGWAEITGARSAGNSPMKIKVTSPVFNFDRDDKKEFVINETSSCSSTIKLDEDGNENEGEHIDTSGAGILCNLMKKVQSPRLRAKPNVSKLQNIYLRGQTLEIPTENSFPVSSPKFPQSPNNYLSIEDLGYNSTPPRTSIFESAGDVLNPPLPPTEYFLEFSSRPQTIFHDRIYYPTDIPPHRQEEKYNWISVSPRVFLSPSESTSGKSFRDLNSSIQTCLDEDLKEPPESSSMKIEEKIARAYHHGLSWRKVLVRLEPDAHNNIIVRRMFPNAYGWPVVKHLCDSHFSVSAIAWSHSEDDLHENLSSEINENRAYNECIDSGIGWSHREGDESGTESEDEFEPSDLPGGKPIKLSKEDELIFRERSL